MVKETLRVTGMMCAHCEHAVDTAVGALPGVTRVKANHKKERVELRFDETQTSLDAIRAAICEAGYQAV